MYLSNSAVLVTVFFVQGLAFYAMSVSIVVASRPRAALAIARSLWLLAAFGLLHSAAAWVELAEQLLPERVALAGLLAPLPTALLVLYSVCLAQFGANVIATVVHRHRWVRSLPLALFLWVAIPGLVVGAQDGAVAPRGLVVVEAIGRYVLHLPAAALSALAFHLQGSEPSFERLPELRRDCRLASLAFAAYAVSGGILVPSSILFLAERGSVFAPSAVAQLPVQMVRLLLAPVIAWVVVRTLRVFEFEHLLEVEDLNRRLHRLSRKAVTAQEEERRRISLELHDETAQLLSSLLVHLKLLQGSRDLEQVRLRSGELIDLASEASLTVRHMAGRLRPVALDDLGLVAALQWHIEDFAQREKLAVDMKMVGLSGRLDQETELAAYRIVQECLRNVARHAHARSVRVLLEARDGHLRITICDDGCGFDPIAAYRSDSAGLGILGMSERAALVGGTLEVDSSPGRGTTIRADIPLKTGGVEGTGED